MKILSIEELIKNPLNLRLSHSYHKYDNVEKMDIYREENCYHILATVNVLRKIYDCEFYITEDGIISDYHCDCPWSDEQSPCGHIGCVLLKIIELQPTLFPFHYQSDKQERIEEERKRIEKENYLNTLKHYTHETHNLIEQFKTQYQAQIVSVLEDEQYEIEPVMDLEFSDLFVSYKVGNEKKYVIKNIFQFLMNIENKKTVKYGKFLSFTHQLSAFDEFAQKQINFLKVACNGYLSNDYYYTYATEKRIHLIGGSLDLFFDTYYEEDFSQFTLTHSDKKACFSLIKENELYILNRTDQTEYIYGEKYIYNIYEEYDHIFIERILSDEEGILSQLILEMPEEGFPILEKDYSDFYKYVLSPILDYIDLSSPIDMIDNRYDNVRLYGDINEQEEVVIWLEYINEDGHRQHGFDIDFTTNYTQDVVEKYIEKYARSIDYDKHLAYLDINNEKTYEFIQEGLIFLKDYCEIYVSDSLKKLGMTASYKMTVGVKFEGNLLSLNIESMQIPNKELADVLEHYRRKKKFYRLKNGELLYLNSPQLEELDHLMNDYHLDSNDIVNGEIILEPYRMFSLDKDVLQTKSVEINRHDSFVKKIEQFKEKDIHHYALPKHYDSILRDYQKEGIKWMWILREYGFNGILADDMGLGKTLQIIALLDSLSLTHPSLVVCPSSLIYNWEAEVHKFSQTLKVIPVTGNQTVRKNILTQVNGCELLVTSYEYIRRDIDLYEDMTFEYVILDEAQYIKNQKTKNAMTVKKIKSLHRLALTGTPIENSLAELWSIFDFLMPQYLFNYHYFNTQFETAIVKNQDTHKTEQLRKLVSPFILRRNKKDVLKELPDKIETTQLIQFNQEENELYLANLAQVNHELQSILNMENVNKVAILAMLTRLRQICCEPRLVYENIESTSSKLNACIELISTLYESNQKVLLFSSFTSVLDLIAKELSFKNISYYMLSGKTSKEERRDLVNQFQSNQTTVFLISLKAGGTGLNLTAAQAVIHYDPWWNVSAQNQATDRAYRIGQENKVQVFKLVMKDSIEEKIMLLQERKKELADAFVENNQGSLASMSKDDIMQLLTMDNE